MYSCNYLSRPWPYEHIVPGAPEPPPGVDAYLKRQEAKEARKQERCVDASLFLRLQCSFLQCI